MPRAETNKRFNTFVGGLITETNKLSFPENASLDEDNFVLKRDGTRRRRLGINFEQNHTLRDSGISSVVMSSYAITTHTWLNINNDPGVGLLVVQLGNSLYFYDLFAESISSNIKNGGSAVTISPDVLNPIHPIQATSISGALVIVTGAGSVQLLEYNATTDSVAITEKDLYIRDIFGVDDGLPIDIRPNTLATEHKYNLYNQGWDDTKLNAFNSSVSSLVLGFSYPSNADITYLGKDTNGDFTPTELLKQEFGNTPAPKGHFVIKAFDRGTSRAAESGLPLETPAEAATRAYGFSNTGPVYDSNWEIP